MRVYVYNAQSLFYELLDSRLAVVAANAECLKAIATETKNFWTAGLPTSIVAHGIPTAIDLRDRAASAVDADWQVGLTNESPSFCFSMALSSC